MSGAKPVVVLQAKLDPVLHARVRAKAATLGLTLTDAVRLALEAWLREA